MPIRKECKHLYPDNWDEIREKIRERAHDTCEWCGVPNHASGYRDKDGNFWIEDGSQYIPDEALERKQIKIVCTTAHLDR